MKKYFVAVVLFAVTPSIAFASWWNPLSWNWRDLFSTPLSTVVQIPVATTSPIQTTAESTTTATTTISVIATSTEIITPVVIKKIVTKVSVPVQPTVAPTVVATPVVTAQPQPTVATTTPVAVPVAPFVVTSPQGNLLWNTNANETISWSPYLGGSYFDHYEVIIGNTVANVGSQLPDTSIEVSDDQTSVIIPTSNFLAEFSAKSNIPENQINNNFYIQVNAIRFLLSNTPVASTQEVSFGLPLIPTVNVTASTTILSSKSSSAIVSWTSTNATSCSLDISPLPSSETMIGTTTTSGSLSTGALGVKTTYTVTCVNGSNSVSDNAVVPI